MKFFEDMRKEVESRRLKVQVQSQGIERNITKISIGKIISLLRFRHFDDYGERAVFLI